LRFCVFAFLRFCVFAFLNQFNATLFKNEKLTAALAMLDLHWSLSKLTSSALGNYFQPTMWANCCVDKFCSFYDMACDIKRLLIVILFAIRRADSITTIPLTDVHFRCRSIQNSKFKIQHSTLNIKN